MYITKKRDCNVAVPLFKALVLPANPNKQHCSPRRMYMYYTQICVYNEYTLMSISAAMFWVLLNLPDSEEPKQSA